MGHACRQCGRAGSPPSLRSGAVNRRSYIVKTTPTSLILSAVAALALYVGGYFVVVHKQLQNPFIHWPIRRPIPMVEYYQVPSLQVIYEPLVRLDKKLFPRRWVYPRTSDAEIAAAFKNIDVNRMFEMSKPPSEGATSNRQSRHTYTPSAPGSTTISSNLTTFSPALAEGLGGGLSPKTNR